MVEVPRVELPNMDAVVAEYSRFANFIGSSKKLKAMQEDVRKDISPSPREVVYREHSLTLYRYKRSTPAMMKRPLLIIPSLVNKPFIMDMLSGESFVEAMLKRSFDVFMLEWGEPTPGQKDLTMEYYLRRYMKRAVRRTMKAAGTDGVNLAGYCLGGTMALLYAATDKGEQVKSLITMVTPFNFEDEGMLSWWAKEEHLDIDKVVDTYGNVPADFFSQSFPWLVPQANLTKLRTLYENHENSGFMRSFLALDIWGKENTAFPGEVYRSIIKNGYQKNTLVKTGAWPLESDPLSMEDVKIPCLNLAAQYDHIAPAKSCTVLTELLPNAFVTSLSHPTTHLGFALGKDVLQKSTPEYWDLIGDWVFDVS